jgi:peptide/nickel transport system ATP-binding protein
MRMPDEKRLCLSGTGLTKVFGFGRTRTVAVDHVDFEFHEGEVISIVGESGSGKTTFAKLLLGLINPTEGEIYFQGQKRDISSGKKKQEYWKTSRRSFRIRSLPTTRSAKSIPCSWIVSICGAVGVCRASRKSP